MASFFFVSYDVTAPGTSYQRLESALVASGAMQVQRSLWVMKGAYTVKLLMDALLPLVDGNARVFVIEGTNVMWLNTMFDLNRFQ